MQKNTHVCQKKRPPAGFTLVEVMITLVVIAIAAALASPAFLAMAPEMQLRGTAQDLYSSIQEAKILAVKENRGITIRFSQGLSYIDLDGDLNWDINEDENGNGILDSGEDKDGDGKLDVLEPHVFFDEDFNENGILDAGEDVNGNGKLDTKYGIGLGTGAAVNNWNGDAFVQAASITFNSRGTTQNAASIYIDNRNKDICYAVTTQIAGSVKIRKFNGTSWIE